VKAKELGKADRCPAKFPSGRFWGVRLLKKTLGGGDVRCRLGGQEVS